MTEARIGAIATAAGIVGALAVTVASVVAALAYTGTAGERYSPLDHWVSELGEVGVSELAPLFNIGLLVGGVCFGVFMVGLAAVRRGRLGLAYGAIGAAAGLAGGLVGVFPMNELEPHALAAFGFFNLAWIAVALASLDFVRRRDPRFPVWLSVVGAAAAVAFVTFLLSVQGSDAGDEALAAPDARPELGLAAALEWLTIVGILAWAFLTAVAWRRAMRPAASAAQPSGIPA